MIEVDRVVETPVNPKARFGAVPVEPIWPGSTIVCIGSGPSLTREDVDYCRGRARVIAIKDAIRLAPWADVLYAAGDDSSFWWQKPSNRHYIDPFEGLRYSLDPQAQTFASILDHGAEYGLSTNPSQLGLGHHSGHQATNLAILLGAVRIVYLGFDMRPDAQGRDHFFGQHERGNRPPFGLFLYAFEHLVKPLAALGIEVINCSRETALTIFPRRPLREVLQ